MNNVPFSVYDFFAYLSSGAVILMAIDYVAGTGMLTRDKISPVLGIALVILAYVSGQIVAQFSSLLFEQTIAARILKRPSLLLLGDEPRWKVFAWVFPNYHKTLPENMQKRVREQAAARGCFGNGEGLFLHAYSLVSRNERTQSRLDSFLNQYGFARNVGFAFIASSVALVVAHFCRHPPVPLRWSFLAAFAGVSLFYRYLKFFRQYSYEVFLRYAELPFPAVEPN